MLNILALIVFFILLFALIYVFGEYIAWIYQKETRSKNELPKKLSFFKKLDRPFKLIEEKIFSFLNIEPDKEMNWKQYLFSLLIFNGILFVFLFLVFKFQNILPLNPLNLDGMSWDQAFHTASTFISNTNQQHYGGETLSYFSQLFAVCLAMFLSAGTGLALAPAFTRGIQNEEATKLGNFYVNLIKGLIRFLLPVSFIVGLILISQGSPQWFGGEIVVNTIEGVKQVIRIGPVAGIEAIKTLGTNGGGYFAANAAHPFENPTILANIVLNLIMLASPMAIIYAFGIWIGKRRHGVILIGALFVIFLGLFWVTAAGEAQPNRAIIMNETNLTVDQSAGNMEGKETRFGSLLSSLWAISTTSTTNGAVNSMHNSYTPQGSVGPFLAMAMNCLYNGIGVGLLNLMTYIFICVFIAGLMIGRAPQYLGKQIEWREVKIAALIILLLPVLVLFPTSIAVITEAGKEAIHNPGFTGFSEVLYEMFSAGANNGSGMEGLMDNSVFYNLLNGGAILMGRYLPIFGQLVIAGNLSKKKIRPETEGTLKVENLSFLVLFVGVMIIIGGLIFMPALAVGPIAEMLSEGM
ncbi:K+-transporting ATPase ATPase A chain [Halanaerobium congolense]|uniref:Potassium-transporting ATPase potassium-binding subunit n=1 Tax=Halanaerobium congolense TaxID=54121 RepID=A0A4R8G3B7_9FIRM|nr:potassium-transporting ATPase subunit KdpA [Halanaerobium congolense]TDX35909.1 K+-transporting ATPase ATPase A chain [Halanaerobium congolense]